jgi:hypothetical protein
MIKGALSFVPKFSPPLVDEIYRSEGQTLSGG